MSEIKDWPYAGKVMGALTLVAGFVSPLVFTTWAFANASADIRYQRQRSEEQYADTIGRLKSISIEQASMRDQLSEQSTILIEAREERRYRFTDLERRVGALEAAIVSGPPPNATTPR